MPPASSRRQLAGRFGAAKVRTKSCGRNGPEARSTQAQITQTQSIIPDAERIGGLLCDDNVYSFSAASRLSPSFSISS